MSNTLPPAPDIALGTPAPVVSVKPVVLAAPDRGDDLQVRVSAPRTGTDLPIVVFSHGFGFSMDGYGPLADFWAAHGFVVLQPTHLDSMTLGVAPDDPRTPNIWRYRIDDLVRVLDELDRIEAEVPELRGRLARDRIAAAGHSYGATTASALLGARILDPEGRVGEDRSDPRVAAGVLLALAGTGGENLTPFAAEAFPFMNPSFAAMTTPALITAGDHDQSMLSVRGPDWWTDAYTLSPQDKSLLTLFGAEHSQGGIDAYGGVPQTPAESPALLGLVQRITTAYLRTTLGVDEASWPAARDALAQEADPVGRLQSK
jgi:pimeloyl-ACP methyl ester carboxylesterase